MEPRKRVTHFNLPSHAHSLTFSCNNRHPYFKSDRTCRWLIEAIDKARSDWNFRLWAYVIMPEHVHIIVWPNEKIYDISDFLKSIKQSVSRNARYFLEKENPLALEKMILKRGNRATFKFWQTGPGYDLNLYADEKLMEKIEYIHNNPVRRSLVKSTTDWKWSSACWYAGFRNVPIIN